MRSVPLSGSSPDAIAGLSSNRGCVTGLSGLASLSSGGVNSALLLPPQAARSVLRLDRPTRPAAERLRNSGRPYLASRGCSVIPNLPVVPHIRVKQSRGYRSIGEHDERVDCHGVSRTDDQRVHLDRL